MISCLIVYEPSEEPVIISAENVKDCVVQSAEYTGDKSPLLLKALVGCDTVKDIVDMFNCFGYSEIKAIYRIDETLYRKEGRT